MPRPISQGDPERLRIKIERHKDILRTLRSEANRIDEAILDSQMVLVDHFSSIVDGASFWSSGLKSAEETSKQILRHQNSAAAVFCHMSRQHPLQSPYFTKDILGVVGMLATVENDNLSCILSEFLGFETMTGIVCRTMNGVNELMKGTESTPSLIAYASSIGQKIDNRFIVFCLEELRPYSGDFVKDDPQRKLHLPDPELADGSCPTGFLGFAVNMVDIETCNLSLVTRGGDGLRETLMYNLFNELQVYRTRGEMLSARACITHGAVSLDGGMMKEAGVFRLGKRGDAGVKFAGFRSPAPGYVELEERIKKLKWESENVSDDIKRESKVVERLKKMAGSEASNAM